MQFLVGYNGSNSSISALSLARDHARVFNAEVLILYSTEGGASESLESINHAETELKYASDFIAETGIACQTHHLARGLTPGEDLVRFAVENNVDQIYVGIEKRSKTHKLLLGSTAQFVILKAPCPVVTIK